MRNRVKLHMLFSMSSLDEFLSKEWRKLGFGKQDNYELCRSSHQTNLKLLISFRSFHWAHKLLLNGYATFIVKQQGPETYPVQGTLWLLVIMHR